MEDIKFYTLKEIQAILHISQRTLMTYLKEGRLKGVKIGGKWIISQENFDNFLNGK